VGSAGSHRVKGEERALEPWLKRAIPLPPRLGGDTHPERTRDRVRGMLHGLAIGDSLGNTTEGLTPAERRRAYGEIRDYLPSRWSDMVPAGVPSDDTQLAFWTVESLLRRGRLDPVDLADTFTGHDRIFGIGSAVTAFLFAYRFGGKRWFEAGQASAGNGALMRISPVLLPHLQTMTEALWTDVTAATILTHRDEAAVAASVGFVGLLVECLARSGVEELPAHWWSEIFLRYARPAEGTREDAADEGADVGEDEGFEASCVTTYRSRVPGDPFEGSLCDRVEREVPRALEAGEDVLPACGRWHSGAYLLETVPCALHILGRHGADPEEAIVRAVNDTKDNDTIAAVVGAAVGALHGERALPVRWREGLLGRTREEDDGHVQELIDRAVDQFFG